MFSPSCLELTISEPRAKECEIGQPGRPAHVFHEGFGSGILESFVLFVFLNDKLHGNEIFLEHWLDVRPVQEGVQPFAPPAP